MYNRAGFTHKRVFPGLAVSFISVVFCSCLSSYLGNYVEIKGRRFYVEVARTPEQRHRGLMFRRKLEENRGMLFVFPEEGRYNFWMKNTYIPLDMIWINKDKKIVYIKHSASPCVSRQRCPSIVPSADATYVLEVKGGICRKFNFSRGDTVTLHFSPSR